MPRLASCLTLGALLFLPFCVPESARGASSGGSTPVLEVEEVLGALTGRLTLESTQPLSSRFPDDRIPSPVFEPPQAPKPRAQIRGVPGPGAFLAVGAGALLLAASLRRRPR